MRTNKRERKIRFDQSSRREANRRFCFERLEDRRVLATIAVTGVGDTIAVDGVVTLREAITSVNNGANINADVIAAGAYGTSDTVNFNIAGAGAQTINVTTGQLNITKTVTIDGFTQPGAAFNAPLIELNGASLPGFPDGLNLTNVSNCLIRGLVINRFAGSGIAILGAGSTGNRIQGNFIGTNATGAAPLANNNGVGITAGASGNIVGTDGDGVSDNLERNVISGNTQTGVVITRVGTSGNRVAGNFIGANATGTAALANSAGVSIFLGATGNIIGTNGDGVSDAAEANVISGNSGRGMDIASAGTTGNRVAGNFIGTNPTGTAALANGTGVNISVGASGNIVGTDGLAVNPAAQRNVISGNSGIGVQINATAANMVAGNFIGTDVTGAVAIANNIGVTIGGGATGNLIGTNADGVSDALETNVISGNSAAGVQIIGAGTSGNVVAGNKIGTNAAGTAALGNGTSGVNIQNGAMGNRVGTNGDGVNEAAETNLISGNGRGVVILGVGTSGNRVAGNKIGTNAAGTAGLGNKFEGVLVLSRASGNFVGTDGNGSPGDAAEGNLISGNSTRGVRIQDAGTTGNRVAGNFIGTDVSGAAGLGNGSDGVAVLNGASGNIIGTNGDGVSDAAERNIISGNTLDGVSIFSAGTSGNRVAGNFIGTDLTGTAALPNENGVTISAGASGNIIGTNGDGSGDAAEGNVISGNFSSGVLLTGAGASSNLVAGNKIGMNAAGDAAIANTGDGVRIDSGASNNTIGGSTTSARNIISSNGGHGIYLLNSGTSGNLVQGNYVGTDVTGSVDLGNSLDGVASDAGASDNTIDRNVISGNGQDGIEIGFSGGPTTGIVVTGNFIGTNAAGTAALPNDLNGIAISGTTSDNLVGGSTIAARNIISGNTQSGIQITGGGATDNRIQGNFIGTDVSGAADLGNTLYGVYILSGSHDNLVGGTPSGARNVIAYNAKGVVVGSSTSDTSTLSNTITRNRIFDNDALGIDLANDGVTLNDPGDSDAGPNHRLNFPVFTGTIILGTKLYVAGFARSGSVIELFIADPDPTGFGEGRVYLVTLVEGSADDLDAGTGSYGPGPVNGIVVGSDTTNRFLFGIPLSSLSAPVTNGDSLTATATSASLSTSEFSGNITLSELSFLSGSVYVDRNNNGRRNAGELPIPGVTVRLVGTTNLNIAVNRSVTTDIDGNFAFVKILPGTYQLRETQPTNFIDGKLRVGSLGGVATTNRISNIVVGSSQQGVNYQFGERGLTPSAISKRNLIANRTGSLPPLGTAGPGIVFLGESADPSGYVYVDRNGNGRRDAGEKGIAGVTMKLTGKTLDGRKISLTTKTNSRGFYQFDFLPPGTYSLIQKQPKGYRDGKESLGSLGGKVGQDRFDRIVLREGDVGTDYNFGELLTVLARDQAKSKARKR